MVAPASGLEGLSLQVPFETLQQFVHVGACLLEIG
jgi:hypothetical protein